MKLPLVFLVSSLLHLVRSRAPLNSNITKLPSNEAPYMNIFNNGTRGYVGDKSRQTPFPQWLADFTGLSEWPGLNPPYIPLDFIDFNKIPNIPRYGQSECNSRRKQLLNNKDVCSFDCDACVEKDDIFTCPKLSQTFDDGPSFATESLLNHIKNKSTFFNLGINIINFPSIYQKMMDRGHLIGTHTWSHPYLPNLSNEDIIAEIEWSIWAMNATGHHLPRYFRPPYGGIDNRVRSITRQFGLQAVLWDHDTFDWRLVGSNNSRHTERDIYKSVINWIRKKTGLILEHDGAFKTVEIAKNIYDLIGPDQLNVAECVGGTPYLKTFPS
ncbi:hypothetical protein TPHA_0K01980 [Tetrapisispora phaffii CBS 4417]|uniref:chitin deacetylase n=1 Tax=Tetrapisispora phaffii (strain ATCC 24235 / CBS 4417 / NBRC 1672 / NRRL Y-8282 / UCD 70-5) TaxID=1071381 RepID=G8BZK3_TETPH|nr:hypothetical protein TPHA_0K01980 [Tetrapisispora phaffii CBS 4417]CCE65331.1 hypothetical protein TPHA_0K01980 [Tetrapisispora phaffii CBS 4417]